MASPRAQHGRGPCRFGRRRPRAHPLLSTIQSAANGGSQALEPSWRASRLDPGGPAEPGRL